MAAPSEKLTTNAQATLGEPVTIAVRVKPGKASGFSNPFVRSALAFMFTIPYLVLWLVKKLLSPVVASFRAPSPRVLAFMPDGSHRLLSARAKTEMRSFPASSSLSIDHERFESVLLAEATIDDFTCVINGVDLKALLRVAAAGEITDPDLAKLARAHERYASSLLGSQQISKGSDRQGLAKQLDDPVQ